MEGIPEAIKKDLYHDQCDEISYFEEPNQPGTYEAAFFRSDEWQTDVIEQFSFYTDDVVLDTRVYRFIPEDTLMEFIEKWGSSMPACDSCTRLSRQIEILVNG